MGTEKRLIDANPVINGIGDYVTSNAYLNDTALDAFGMVEKWLEEAPTVDAVEVVRCKDCKYRKKQVCANPSAGMWVGVELRDERERLLAMRHLLL